MQETDGAPGQQYEYRKGGKPEGLAARRDVRKSDVRREAVEGPPVGSGEVPSEEDVAQKMEADVEGNQARNRHALDLLRSMGCCSQSCSGNKDLLHQLSNVADYRCALFLECLKLRLQSHPY